MTIEILIYRTLTILVALFVDRLFGDPPNQWHPVAWMGSLIYFLKSRAPQDKPDGVKFLYGGLISLVGLVLLGAVGVGLTRLMAFLPLAARLLIGGLLLKALFSFRMLLDIGREIQDTLESGSLGEARRLLSWHLVSRDTSTLDQTAVTAAAVESIAENATDSIISPLFYYLLFGFPGILFYRYANTCDAILGYRDPASEWLGKIPARLDDLLNLLPARLTAFLLIAAAALPGFSFGNALAVWWRDRYKTTSPNAGHTMAAAAGALGIVLDKDGVYVLGEGGRPAEPADLGRGVRLARAAVYAGVILLVVVVAALKWRHYAG
ncbi:MAG TPA: adenosylcobinamide-phosphate synthase CbiB [Anaerolineales bacterium]|nr:adenosylcobinamide-phosphate synthase CbiB [Anaerolineales bacterium]